MLDKEFREEYDEYGFMVSISNKSWEEYDGPPHGGDMNIASAWISGQSHCMAYFMYLCEKVAVDELDFIQYTVDFGIVFRTGYFDRIYINGNDSH